MYIVYRLKIEYYVETLNQNNRKLDIVYICEIDLNRIIIILTLCMFFAHLSLNKFYHPTNIYIPI